MRFSLKTLVAAFTLVVVSIVGLLYASRGWAAFFYTAAFVLVLTGIVGALVRSGAARAYWIGFALFGGGYFWLALVAEGSLFLRREPDFYYEPQLATTHLLAWVEPFVRSNDAASSNSRQRPRTAPWVLFSPTGMMLDNPQYFVKVGHSIFTLLFALLGGAIGARFVRCEPLALEE